MKSNIKPTEHAPSIISYRLEQVLSLHPAIECVCEEFEIALIAMPKNVSTSYPGLLSTLARTPIPVTRQRNQIFCTGNFRAYLMAKALLPSDSTIHCIESSGCTDENIRQNFLAEFIYQPAIFGVQQSKVDELTQVARLAFARKYLDGPLTSVETHISNLYRVDRRTLLPKPMISQTELYHDDFYSDMVTRTPWNTSD
jgi:hypothetical protein